MALTMIEPFRNHSHPLQPINYPTPKPLRVCFSYAAYAKNLIYNLRSSNIAVEPGLSDAEFSTVESTYNFTFPPDLRSILQEGLPIGPGFPNWRSSSKQQLNIIVNLPILGICKEVSRDKFWIDSWGERPDETDRAVKLAERLLKKCPVLVPLYQHFYIPSIPCMAGNPIFYVHGRDVSIWSFDIAGFFQQFEFKMSGGDEFLWRPQRTELSNLFSAPAWAAKEARVIEFWTDVAERVRNVAAREEWWSGELSGCLEEVCCTLRDGGWKEEDVKEMMMMDGCDGVDCEESDALDREFVDRRVKVLSDRLLRAGWSTEDVVESLGFYEDDESCFDYFHNNYIGSDNCDENNLNLQMERVDLNC